MSLSCPPGSLAPSSSGNPSVSSCLPCPIGMFCGLFGASSPTGVCAGGYVCTGSSNTSTPTTANMGYMCRPGYYCPVQATNMMQCNAGSYNPNYGQSACLSCPPGSLCMGLGLTNYSACPLGSYCPLGSPAPIGCPPGTFSNQYNIGNVSDCLPCLRGQFCASTGMSTTSGFCIAGFFCNAGSASYVYVSFYHWSCSFSHDLLISFVLILNSPAPPDQKCPAGYFCGNGTIAPSPCLPSTYNPNMGSVDISSCALCTPGSYCSTQGLAAPTGPCQGGYYCLQGASTPNSIVWYVRNCGQELIRFLAQHVGVFFCSAARVVFSALQVRRRHWDAHPARFS